MLRITLKLPSGGAADPASLRTAVSARLGLEPNAFVLIPRRRSVDARGTPVFVWTADLQLADPKQEKTLLRKHRGLLEPAPEEDRYVFPAAQGALDTRPIVVGFGPAGIFCALLLARSGLRPIVLERGGSLEERVPAVEKFFREGTLDPSCNIQFGEGGAGAFSDGKLNTLVKDRSFRGYFVLEQLVAAGAPEELLWQSKPHIGTDLLRGVLRNLRQEICDRGGEVLFRRQVKELLTEDGRVTGVVCANSGASPAETFRSDTVVLALGHSARDTFRALHAQGVPMERKPFSVGVRIEHPQAWINLSQYGAESLPGFPAADYKLVAHTADGRTVYSFCMCPGGVVVAAASEEGGVVTNGMSYHARDGVNANSALLCEVLPSDLPEGLFAGMEFQRQLEQAAFRAGGGDFRAPAQTVGDFLAGVPTVAFGEVTPTYSRGVTPSNLREVLPAFVSGALAEALPLLGRKLKGFDHPEAVLTGVESRSTSPVRILRGETMQSSVSGLYPIGEGAGYAGGIISAAIDGVKCAETIVKSLKE
ncbi:MAG: FAD-binding protein [Oscillospiraceae bacterium]|nr:FAD-binding protein [Oscillospiraceae bacterium]